MAMNAAFADVTFNSTNTATATWRHPDQVRASSPAAVELDDTPQFLIPVCTSNNGVNVGIIEWVASPTGITAASTHLTDSSTWRIMAFVKLPPALFQFG